MRIVWTYQDRNWPADLVILVLSLNRSFYEALFRTGGRMGERKSRWTDSCCNFVISQLCDLDCSLNCTMAGFNQGKPIGSICAITDSCLSPGQTLLINPSSFPEPGQSSIIPRIHGWSDCLLSSGLFTMPGLDSLFTGPSKTNIQ